MVGAISAIVLSAFATVAVYRTFLAQRLLKVREHDDTVERMLARYEQEMRE
jgi:uncharacterized membrane protein YdjX (TVP38/TMEM64 family)